MQTHMVILFLNRQNSINPIQAFQWKYGGNFIGNEIVRVDGVSTLEDCIYQCHDHIPCQAFTFISQAEHCILRDGTSSVEEGPLKVFVISEFNLV